MPHMAASNSLTVQHDGAKLTTAHCVGRDLGRKAIMPFTE